MSWRGTSSRFGRGDTCPVASALCADGDVCSRALRSFQIWNERGVPRDSVGGPAARALESGARDGPS